MTSVTTFSFQETARRREVLREDDSDAEAKDAEDTDKLSRSRPISVSIMVDVLGEREADNLPLFAERGGETCCIFGLF